MAYDVMASFTCPRTITFQDYRLGFTHKAIVVAILAYVCFNLFSGQLYLVDSVPLGLVSVWSTSDYNGTSGVSSFSRARDAFYDAYSAKDGSFRYCGNEDYDYAYDESYTYEKIGCAFQEDAELAVKGESQIFFSTMVQTNTVAFVSARAVRTRRAGGPRSKPRAFRTRSALRRRTRATTRAWFSPRSSGVVTAAPPRTRSTSPPRT